MQRTGKFYRNNEKEIMRDLGLKPTFNSGSGPLEKEDGQNDVFICQLKSTDKQSISIQKRDIDILLSHAYESRRTPIFAINFLSDNSVYVMMPKDDFLSLVNDAQIVLPAENDIAVEPNPLNPQSDTIRSASPSKRTQFYDEKSALYEKKSG